MRYWGPLRAVALGVLVLACRDVIGVQELAFAGGHAGASGADSGAGTAGGAGATASASCAALAAICGAPASDDCCASATVPGGSFLRDGLASQAASVSAFELDLYEISVGRVRAFMDAGFGTQERPPQAGSGAHPRLSGSGWKSEWNQYLPSNRDALAERLACTDLYRFWSDAPAEHEARPMNCLRWYEAFAFCIWDGGRLPTEAEWAYAAAGGSEQRVYPWGEAPPDASRASFECLADGNAGCAYADVLPVGSLPLGTGRWGHRDLSGNLQEWLLDSYDDYVLPCSDCATLRDLPADRILRGGAFGSEALDLRTDARGHGTPLGDASNVGARCARDP